MDNVYVSCSRGLLHPAYNGDSLWHSRRFSSYVNCFERFSRAPITDCAPLRGLFRNCRSAITRHVLADNNYGGVCRRNSRLDTEPEQVGIFPSTAGQDDLVRCALDKGLARRNRVCFVCQCHWFRFPCGKITTA